jgi:hypothetical protein
MDHRIAGHVARGQCLADSHIGKVKRRVEKNHETRNPEVITTVGSQKDVSCRSETLIFQGFGSRESEVNNTGKS